jgi:hypothetical protein
MGYNLLGWFLTGMAYGFMIVVVVVLILALLVATGIFHGNY